MMNQEFFDRLYEKLKTGLDGIAAQKLSPSLKLRDQLVLIRESLAAMSAEVSRNPFKDEQAEIEYYKVIQPRFKAELIYHVEVYNMELNAPVESPALLASHYKLCFSVCAQWMKQFKFYQLYRKLDGQELDRLYFVKAADQQSALLPVLAECDESGTAVGYLYAKFRAYELLADFIAREMGKFWPLGSAPDRDGFRFKWTGKTIDLIEVAHGLYLQGEIEKGEAGIVEFFKAFGDFFGVDLGIPKKGLDNLMDRKTIGRTRFTDRMRQSLQGKMDELERYDPDRISRRMGL